MTKLAMVHSKYIGTGNGAYKPKQSLSGITLYIYTYVYIYNPFPPKKIYTTIFGWIWFLYLFTGLPY